ncbi:hypothetical protein C8F04DRAFT_1179432 [Mycena alexandri]|uniref:DUF6532 domain-containing protein n=1 Tax=Mycena alexandri TaxID=1745969 RepID=A0AAD6T3U2_9AGAR|nr:hypothetical protein C8F04DRAFT_1179432 [Mycena alexandri]
MSHVDTFSDLVRPYIIWFSVFLRQRHTQNEKEFIDHWKDSSGGGFKVQPFVRVIPLGDEVGVEWLQSMGWHVDVLHVAATIIRLGNCMAEEHWPRHPGRPFVSLYNEDVAVPPHALAPLPWVGKIKDVQLAAKITLWVIRTQLWRYESMGLPYVLRAPVPVVDAGAGSNAEDELDNNGGGDIEMADAPRRRASLCSFGIYGYNIPVPTDFDESDDMDQTNMLDDNSDEEKEIIPAPPRKSAQQAKYDLEQPTIVPHPPLAKKMSGKKVKVKNEHTNSILPAADIEDDESRWRLSAQIIYCRHGDIKLTDQRQDLQAVLRDTMELVLVDVVFVKPYPEMVVSCGKYVQKYIYQAAREKNATDIKICTRIGIFRNTVKKLVHAKVPVYYQLTSDGVSSNDICAGVKSALQNEQYIFPITWRTPKVVDGAPPPKKHNQEMRFQNNLPFHSAPIINIMREAYFATSKSFGRRFKQLITAPEAFPQELELPDSMPAFIAANVFGVLQTWKNGQLQTANFSQIMLETMYNNLFDTLTSVREDENPELVHVVMHDLYKKTIRSVLDEVTPGSVGSARAMMHLGLADDDEEE